MVLTNKQFIGLTLIIIGVLLFFDYMIKLLYKPATTTLNTYYLILYSIIAFLIIVTKSKVVVLEGVGTAKASQRIIGYLALSIFFIAGIFRFTINLLIDNLIWPSFFIQIGYFIYLIALFFAGRINLEYTLAIPI
jgi:hypothetical protein